MKKRIFIFCLFLLSTITFAQPGCPEMYTMRVIAESGLNMRSEPSLTSEKVVTVPYNAQLKACSNTSGSITVSGITGYWRRCIYRGEVGYMFDGFMEMVQLDADEPSPTPVVTTTPKDKPVEVQPVEQPKVEEPAKPVPPPPPTEKPREFQFLTEVYNYCGNVEEIKPGLVWYGFYPPNEGEKNLRIFQVEIEVVLSKARTTNKLEFDIQTDQYESSIFLLGTNKKLDISKVDTEDNSDLLRYTNRRVFPGQELNLGLRGDACKLSATGSVKSSGDCPDVDNYRIYIKKETQQEITSLIPKGKCGMPEIFWFGDFTGDDIPEIIFVTVGEDRNTFTLLVSDGTEGTGKLLRKETEWIIKKCK